MAYKISSRLHRAFVANVRAMRLELGLTQAEVAAKLEITQPAYAHIEAGRRTPTLEQVENVARALGKNPLQLLIEMEVAA